MARPTALTPAALPSVLITGASKGIGAACTLRLAADGFRVFAGVRNDADGVMLRSRAGDAVAPIILDITDSGQVRAAADRIADETAGRGLHALVNNAGIAVAGPLEFLPLDEFRRQLEVNVVGQLAVTQACLPLLRRARDVADADDATAGRIVFMSSVSGRSALPFMGAYAASKFALEAAADALRLELRPFGLAVILVEPGVITTPLWETSARAANDISERMPVATEQYYGPTLAAMRARVARGVTGRPPERVAAVVARSLATRRPRPRYVIGLDAHARMVVQRLLPDRLRDWLVAQAVRRLTGRQHPS